jgi:tripartite-type tricarboxylate transporter receptor subunit TctC
VVNPGVPATSVAELLKLIRARPGAMTFASSGTGTSIHMSGEMFKHMTKTDIVHVPYKGSAPALTDLLGGQVNMMFDNIPSALPHIKAGKLRALATTGARRDPALPDLPTVAETGIPGYEAGVWFGLAVPAGTPADIVARLNAEAIKGTRSPDFVRRMTELGYVIMGSTPEQMNEMLKAEVSRWTPVVKALGRQRGLIQIGSSGKIGRRTLRKSSVA